MIKSALVKEGGKVPGIESHKNVAVRRNKRAAEQNDCIADCFNYSRPYGGK